MALSSNQCVPWGMIRGLPLRRALSRTTEIVMAIAQISYVDRYERRRVVGRNTYDLSTAQRRSVCVRADGGDGGEWRKPRGTAYELAYVQRSQAVASARYRTGGNGYGDGYTLIKRVTRSAVSGKNPSRGRPAIRVDLQGENATAWAHQDAGMKASPGRTPAGCSLGKENMGARRPLARRALGAAPTGCRAMGARGGVEQGWSQGPPVRKSWRKTLCVCRTRVAELWR